MSATLARPYTATPRHALARLVDAWHRRYWRPDAAALSRFDGLLPVMVVTGGSAGIGLAIARRFAAQDRALLLVGRGADALEAAATALRKTSKARVATLAADVTAIDTLARLDQALAAMGGFADVLVNSAGVGLGGRFAGAAPEAIDALVATNVTALTRLCRHVLAGQLVRGRGGIINLASIGAYLPGPNQAVYWASKAFVLSLSEALAAETAGRGVTVTAVAPGPVDTQFHAKMGTDQAVYRWFPAPPADSVARAALAGFACGRRVVVPGLVGKVAMLGARALPHRLLSPVIAMAFAQRK